MTKEGGGTNSVVDGYIAVTVFIAIVLGLLFGCLYAYLCRKRSRAQNPHTVSNNLGDNIQAIPLYLLKRMTNDFL
jgi:heme/copper-type cytochrome/quinol oxidase subunit 2